MTDVPSITTVVVGHCLPWPGDPVPLLDKGPFDAAAFYYSGTRLDCEIRKISTLGATIGSNLIPPLGERVSLEIATGQRPAGKVAWTGRGEIGVRFDDNIDVVALLNRQLVSQTRERRTMPRLEVRATAHVKCGERFRPAMLRNISARGVQLEGEDLPAIGSYLSVFVDGLTVPAGEVVWRRENVAGIELFEELSWTSIIPWVRTLLRHAPS